MERSGRLLWDVKLPGEKFESEQLEGEWQILHRDQWPSGLEHADENRSGYYLFAETVHRLEKANPYGLHSELISAIWISRLDLGPTATPSVIQYFDQRSNAVRREERYDSLERGGRAAGAEEERWYRKLVQTYDPKSGKLKKEETFRHATTPDGSKFVPVGDQ
jgi:hypothetical protein